jgi:tRNA G18 (ribose-2'-O)-methylase SpoU
MQAIPNENAIADIHDSGQNMARVFQVGYILVLHDIRSAQNVGALFRTADAIGISKIYLSSITPGPIDRFGRARSDIAKTALGAEKTISSEHYTDIIALIETYKMKGIQSLR